MTREEMNAYLLEALASVRASIERVRRTLEVVRGIQVYLVSDDYEMYISLGRSSIGGASGSDPEG